MAELSRVLVVDNYDSFTFNLVHVIQWFVGEKALVVKNDDLEFLKTIKNTSLKVLFDLIVLSPGPGNPYEDVGCVSDFILSAFLECGEESRLPVLFGVCMGYEAIGVRCGINLVKTEPRHGVRWRMEIDREADGDTLFHGLPHAFDQVRYHSWILDPDELESSPDLIVTSRSHDISPASVGKSVHRMLGPEMHAGHPSWLRRLSVSFFRCSSLIQSPQIQTCRIPMSFRHRRLPIYGVQFHPESILSQHGSAIIANACRLSGLFSRKVKLHNDSKKLIICTDDRRQRSICRQISKLQDPEKVAIVYASLFKSETVASVWLDFSTSGGWSFMAGGLQGGSHSAVLPRGQDVKSFLTKYSSEFAKLYISKESKVPLAVPCLFPCLGYECSALTSESHKGDLDAIILISERVLAIEKDTGKVFALFLENDSSWCDSVSEILFKMKMIDSIDRDTPFVESHVLRFTMRDSKPCYIGKIRACKAAIADGESYEVCLTTQIESDDSILADLIDPFIIFESLRKANPAPYLAFFHFPASQQGLVLLSASPEQFLRIHSDGSNRIAQVKPIKGTRRRGSCRTEDEAIKEELKTSSKDLAENLMIVDLVRNDLSTVSYSVSCPSLMHVETYAPYHQLVSTVQARLEPETNILDVVFALFPAGSMTGAPKRRTMQILEALEAKPRGLGYSGAIGFVSPVSGDADLAVSIRSILFKRTNNDSYTVSLGAGGAILKVSDPEEEWREILVKARRNLSALSKVGVVLKYDNDNDGVFIRGYSRQKPIIVSTMRFENAKGVWLLNRHIQRLKNSIKFFCDDAEISSSCIKDRVVFAIKQALVAANTQSDEFNDFEPLIEDGPFHGISLMEWDNMQNAGSTNVRACKIRIEIDLNRPKLEVLAQISPLCYERITRVHIGPVRVDASDHSLLHKTNEWFVPLGDGVDRHETLFLNDRGEITESGIANVACKSNGDWITPHILSPCLPGVLRSLLLEKGFIQEGTLEDTLKGTQLVCFNSVRGLYTVEISYIFALL